MSGLRCWIKARFSFAGRATRLEFWLTVPLALVSFAAFGLVILALYALLSRICQHFHLAAQFYLLFLAFALVVLDVMFYVWLAMAAAIRRTHDLGYSYRESLGLRVNFQGGFKRGTVGPNQYGPDPLQKAASPE